MDESELRALLARMAHALPIESWAHGQRLIEEEIDRARKSEAALLKVVREHRAMVCRSDCVRHGLQSITHTIECRSLLALIDHAEGH